MKWRLVAALVGLTLVVLLVHDIPITRYMKSVEYDRLTITLERDSFIIAGKSQKVLAQPNAANTLGLNEFLEQYQRSRDAVVVVTDEKGVVVASNDPTIKSGEAFITRPEIAEALTGSVVSGQRFSLTLNYELFYVAVPIESGMKTVGAVRITYPTSTIDAIIAKRIRIIEIVAVTSISIAVLLALILAFSITRRLSKLQEVNEKFREGNYAIRADETSGATEIKTLALSFNNMAEQLTRLLDEQRAFAADASHQLRTPLTALQLRLERVTELIEVDPKGAQDRLDAALVETERLQNIVEGLLVLSRMNEEKAPELRVYDLVEVVVERTSSWEAFADELNVTLVLELPKTAAVVAIDGSLEQVIDNFIDNALKATPRGSAIRIRVERQTATTTLHIIDQGPGIPDSDLEKAFNRFWRAQSDAQGSGLGLAIVERLVTASGGKVYLRNEHPNGLDACAEFNNAEVN